MIASDPRILPALGQLAFAELEGLWPASRFVEPRPMQVVAPRTGLMATPRPGSEQVDQLLFGELFDVGWRDDAVAWGRARRDGYVGYVDAAALSPDVVRPTHRVGAVRTLAFAEPSIKSPAWGPVGLNALVHVEAVSGDLALAAGAGWMAMRHLCPVGVFFDDPAGVAERFLGTPYLWGGRDSLGIDCSGLVQQSLYACGQACPRDADQQSALGAPVLAEDSRRGDLVFWSGHVAMKLDAERLIHANGHHMAVTIEAFAVAAARIEAGGGGPPTACRRPSPLVWNPG